MPKAGFEPKTLVKLEETRAISYKRSWVRKVVLFPRRRVGINTHGGENKLMCNYL